MLGVTVETLRRWETEGRLTMERSEGGQRLVEVEEVSRLLEERRRASAARPIVAQSARNHFAGIVTRIERDRVAAVVEVQAGPAPARQPDDRRGRRRPRPQGRRRGDLHGEGNQRRRRDPVGAGDRARDDAAGHPRRQSSRCSSQPVRAPVARRTTSTAIERAAAGRAHDLRRRVPEERARRGGSRLRGSEPGTDLTISTDSSAALETQIEQGAPADVFLSADTTNPQKLVDGGFAERCADHRSPATS